jgi:hypothetical protein
MKDHGLTKSLWTEDDFEEMGWHDARLYAFTVLPESFELVMDLDYITKWVHPVPPETHFSFWVAPATLVLCDVQNISAGIEMTILSDVEILDVKRGPVVTGSGWRWVLELSCGEIALDASGYTQYFRQEPIFTRQQQLGMDARGGVSYARTVFDGKLAPPG